jgi:hypothetical protein
MEISFARDKLVDTGNMKTIAIIAKKDHGSKNTRLEKGKSRSNT